MSSKQNQLIILKRLRANMSVNISCKILDAIKTFPCKWLGDCFQKIGSCINAHRRSNEKPFQRIRFNFFSSVIVLFFYILILISDFHLKLKMSGYKFILNLSLEFYLFPLKLNESLELIETPDDPIIRCIKY